MRYCSHCILPETRPGVEIGADGTCSACRYHAEARREVDWAARRREFERLVDGARAQGGRWDCVIPVSGGKDSTWQTVTCLEHGLHPLAVTWRTPARTELGRRNLENLIELGVDHVDFSVNPQVERRFTWRAFQRFGTTALPMHLAIFNIPLALAVRYDVPLVVWGENSAAEYAGTGPEAASPLLDAAWLRKYGVTHGTTAADWISEELSERDLAAYFGPDERALAQLGLQGIFLGAFFPWDPQETYRVAACHGFEARKRPLTGYYAYADIDDAFLISVHHWMKWLKFGFTRTWDNLALEIRNGRLTRDQAIAVLRERGDETPSEDIGRLARWLSVEPAELMAVAERFRNPEVWTRRDGVWVIDGFLIEDWDWSAAPACAS